MSVRSERVAGTNVYKIEASGKLTKEDYGHFVTELEQCISEEGKVRILFTMRDFHGWEMGAMWEDMKLGVRHFNHIERVAMVGETKWEKGMAMFCKPFTTAKTKYFDVSEADVAETWICEGLHAGATSEGDS